MIQMKEGEVAVVRLMIPEGLSHNMGEAIRIGKRVIPEVNCIEIYNSNGRRTITYELLRGEWQVEALAIQFRDGEIEE